MAVAFFGNSDIAIDAFRREILKDEEQGLGNVIHVNAYKIADRAGISVTHSADYLSWDTVYLITALFMLPGYSSQSSAANQNFPARHGRLCVKPWSILFVNSFSEKAGAAH